MRLLDRVAVVVGRVEIARGVERQVGGSDQPGTSEDAADAAGVNFSIVSVA